MAEECVQLLEKAADLPDIHFAAKSGDLKKARKLLESAQERYLNDSCHLVNSVDSMGQTPLFYACSQGNLKLVEMLVKEFQADSSIQDLRGYTAIAMAALGGYGEIVMSLLADSGLDNALLHYACIGGDVDLVRNLIHCNADTSARDRHFNTPLHVAALSGHKDVVFALINEFGADPEVRGHRGRTLLHSACDGGNVSLVKELILEYGADMYALDSMCRMPIHVAISCWNKDIISVLVGDFNFYFKDVLHKVCKYGNVGVAEDIFLLNDDTVLRSYPVLWGLKPGAADRFLLHHKAVICHLDDQNNTPLHVAALQGKEEIFGSLILFMQHPSDVRSMRSRTLLLDPFPVESLVQIFEHAFRAKGQCGRTLLHSACIGGSITLIQNLLSIEYWDINARDDEMSTPLHLACKEGDVDVVEILALKNTLDENARDSKMNTPLHLACKEGHVHIVEILVLKNTLDVNARDNKMNTPLHLACKEGHVDVVKILVLNSMVDVNARDNKMNTPLHLACKEGHVDVVKILVLNSMVDVNARDNRMNTPLHVACEKGCIDMVECLVHKADLSAQDNRNYTPLQVAVLCDKMSIAHLIHPLSNESLMHVACSFGNYEMVWDLFNHNKKSISSCDYQNNCPVHVAALWGQSSILFNHQIDFDLNLKGHLGRSVLHYACIGGHIGLVQELIDHYKADITKVDDENNTPLHAAALHGRLDVVCWLLETCLADINVKGQDGQTLLHSACIGGNVTLVQILISYFQANLMAVDDHQNTPLHVAALCGKVAVVRTLIKEFNCDVNVKGQSGRTVLHMASLKGDIDLIQTAIGEFKADIMAVDDHNNFPIHVIALHCEKEVLYKMLNKVNFGLSIRGTSGQTLLHIACSQGDVILVQTLIIKHNADIKARNSQGNTPLHVAASSGNKEVVQILIDEFHCDINVTGHGGRSLLHSACLSGNVSLVQLLVNKYKAVIMSISDPNTLHTALWCDTVKIVGRYLANVDITEGTLLHNACLTGDANLVRTLIREYKKSIKVNILATNSIIDTTAALLGEMKVASMLLKEIKCDFSIKGQDSKTLLLICLKEELEVVKSLIMNVQDTDLNVLFTLLREKNREFMLLDELMCDSEVNCQFYKCLLHLRCCKGIASLSRILINKYDADVNCQDDQNNTPLHITAYHSREEMLIDVFGCDVDVVGCQGRSVLHSACIGGHVSLVRTLILQYKADINALDDQLHTPLQVAVLVGQEDVAQVLINEFVKGTSLLHVACSVGNSVMVRKLLQDNAVSIYCLDEQGNTPLHVAALWGHHNLLSSLVKEFQCRLDVKGHLGRSLLHSVCIGGHYKLIEFYLGEDKTDLNSCDDEGNSSLHVAAMHGKEKVVLALINSFNCDPNSSGHLGRSLLHSACCGGNADLIRTLMTLNLKADFTTRDKQGNTPVHVAVLHGTMEVVWMIIKEFHFLVNIKGQYGRTLLHLATLNEDVGFAQTLLNDYGSDITARDDDGNTPWHVAALLGKADVVKVVIKDFDTFDINCCGQGGRTLLHIACAKGDVSLAQAVLSHHGADIAVKDDENNTPLHVAALCDEIEVLWLIFRDFEFDVNSRGQGGRTLLHIFCSKGNMGFAQALLSDYDANITARDNDNNTPLHMAALCGEKELVLHLLSRFEFDLHLKGQNGRTLMHIACSQGEVDLVKTLALDCTEVCSSLDSDMNTPLHLAVLSDKENVVLVLLNEFKCDPKVKNYWDRSLLHMCCSTGNVSLARTLISKHALKVSDQDDESNTPLHIAAYRGRETMVSMLIDEFGCSINCGGYQGRSVLHSACSGGHVSLVRTLILDYKADVNAHDDQGLTPLQVAVLCKEVDVARTLINEFINGTSLLHTACSVGNSDMVRKLLQKNSVSIYCPDEQGNTPLHVAALWGHHNLLSSLVKEFQCRLDVKGHLGRSLLHSVCIGGHHKLIEFYLGEDKTDLSSCDDEGNSPLHVAAMHGKEKVVLALINSFNCDRNSTGHLGRSLLHSACCGGNINLIRTLMSLCLKADFTTQDNQGNTPLHAAALCGQFELIQSVIKKFKVSLGFRGQGGKTLLHIVCEKEAISLAQALIRYYGADIMVRDDNSNTPLHVAAMSRKTEVVLQLLKYKFDIGLRGQNGRTLLHVACSEGELSLVDNLVLKQRSACSSLDDDMNTPLHLAVLAGKDSVVWLLINKFMCDPRVRGQYGRSLLHMCCSTGNVSLARTLIFNHALDVGERDDENNTPLHIAAYHGREKLVFMLIDEFKCKVNERGHQGRSVLHSACCGGHVSLARTLILQYKASICAVDDKSYTPVQVSVLHSQRQLAQTLLKEYAEGISLLHIACSVGNDEMVRDLLRENPAAIDSYDQEGNTPLHVVAFWGQLHLIHTLTSEYNCNITSRNRLGRTLLHNACMGGHYDQIQVHLDKYDGDLNSRDNDNNTPLHVAAMHGQERIVLALINDFHCDPNSTGNLGRPLLHSACCGQSASLVHTLVNHIKADITSRDAEENTPLHVAALSGNMEMVITLIDKFECDPTIRGYEGRSLLHSACAGGNADLVSHIWDYWSGMSLLDVDSNGNTVLHTASFFGHTECVEILLSLGAPIFICNAAGKTPVDVASEEVEVLLRGFLANCKQKIYSEYAKKKFSGATPITRIFVIGNPGAGKSSLVETLKREKLFDYFRAVSVPPHTAGIIPSIHMSKQCGRILFYDFAGNPEYYSSHAAILENYSLSTKGDNIFIIVVDLREENRKILQYWTSFIRYQKFTEKKRYLIIAGSHLDSLKWGDRTSKTRFTDACEDIIRKNSDLKISFLMLNCCSPQSRQVTELQNLILSQTKDSPSYSLSVQASILLGLLEKDFKHVISCSIQSLLSHIKDTGIALPLNSKDLCLVLQELHDIGLLFLIFDKEDEDDKLEIILSISQLTNEVHQCLFSKDAPKNIQHLNSENSFNIGIIPLNVLSTILPEFISIECLVQLQYCHKVSSQDIIAFPTATPSSSTDQSYLFFPALCTAKKSDVSWSSPLEIKYSIGWLAQCAVPTDCFPPRFLHVLLLRVVFKFTLSIPHSQNPASQEHRIFKRLCTMWSTGVHWLMEEGVECMVELVDESRAVVVVVKSGEEAEMNYISMLAKITDCVTACMEEFCHTVKYDVFFLDSTDETDYFNDDNMYPQSRLDEILASPEGRTVTLSKSGRKKSAKLLRIFKLMKHPEQPPDQNVRDFSSYVSSLPPEVRHYLDYPLDWDNCVDRDLRKIAHYMLGWDVNLATPLGLTYVDISDIKGHPNLINPALQRREALERWQKHSIVEGKATYGALLQLFANAGHEDCAEALCSVLKEKSCSGNVTQTNFKT